MKKEINVFIPAAGLGERLRPITDHIPKPLMPILGKPVIQLVLERLVSLPVCNIGINLHYKKEALEDWINKYFSVSSFGKGVKGGSSEERVKLFLEENILGTGGALKNAEAFLSERTFLVHNSDILSDIDLVKLLEHHVSSGNLVTLAVHDHPKFNNVAVDEKGFLVAITPSPLAGEGRGEGGFSERSVAFTGIAMYEPEFLKFLPPGASSVVDAWLSAVGSGHKIGTFDISREGFETRPCWSDIGTPDAYASAVFDALGKDGETVYIHPSSKGCNHVEFKGLVVIEEECDAGGPDSASLLRNCILLPGSSAGTIYELSLQNCILGQDFKIDLNTSEVFGAQEGTSRQAIGTGGSDRQYFRIERGGKSLVQMKCNSSFPDFERHIEYTNFLRRHSVPVPELIEAEPHRKEALFEDAGDTSLYNYLKCPRDRRQTEEIYRRVLDALISIHSAATEHVAECPLLQNRIFDYEYFRWETDYFLEQFVKGICKRTIENVSVITDELNSLAKKADFFPKTIIHRDFQSQNIMIMHDGGLRIIDFQGARMGPPAYDIASILWDPYYRLDDDLREALVNYYISQVGQAAVLSFHKSLIVCRLQRHMQALGAYGFLSLVKGKRYFQKHIPEGLRLLKEDASLAKDEYPELYRLIMSL